MLGTALYVALQRKINMEEVLTHRLILVLLSLCHINGKMSKITRSTTLMKELEKSRVLNNP